MGERFTLKEINEEAVQSYNIEQRARRSGNFDLAGFEYSIGANLTRFWWSLSKEIAREEAGD